METNWRSGHKVFATEEEAEKYSKDMLSRGIVIFFSKTYEPVTHEYIGPDGMTQEV